MRNSPFSTKTMIVAIALVCIGMESQLHAMENQWPALPARPKPSAAIPIQVHKNIIRKNTFTEFLKKLNYTIETRWAPSLAQDIVVCRPPEEEEKIEKVEFPVTLHGKHYGWEQGIVFFKSGEVKNLETALFFLNQIQ